jgi:hypothetical protein
MLPFGVPMLVVDQINGRGTLTALRNSTGPCASLEKQVCQSLQPPLSVVTGTFSRAGDFPRLYCNSKPIDLGQSETIDVSHKVWPCQQIWNHVPGCRYRAEKFDYEQS